MRDDLVALHFMKLKPVDHRILVQLYFPPEDGGIVLPGTNLAASVEDKRTLIECLLTGENVEVCKPGDFLLLHADAMRNAIPITKEPATMLIHDSQVLGIIEDDERPIDFSNV